MAFAMSVFFSISGALAVPTDVNPPKPIDYQPAVAGLDLTGCNSVTDAGNFLGCYISSLYTFLVQAAIILAVLMIVIGGFKYLFALGNQGKLSDAKETIQVAIIGLVLALTSYLLFNLINPRITDRGVLNIPVLDLQPTATSTPAIPGRVGSCAFSPAPWEQLYKIGETSAMGAASKQKLTAHPDIIKALKKLDDRLAAPDKAHIIANLNSISDGNVFLGNCKRNDDGTLTSDCQHGDSWHYGGSQNRCLFDRDHPPVSCAVDLSSGTQAGYPTLYTLMYDSGFNFVQCEKDKVKVDCNMGSVDHIHGQVSTCSSLL